MHIPFPFLKKAGQVVVLSCIVLVTAQLSSDVKSNQSVHSFLLGNSVSIQKIPHTVYQSRSHFRLSLHFVLNRQSALCSLHSIDWN